VFFIEFHTGHVEREIQLNQTALFDLASNVNCVKKTFKAKSNSRLGCHDVVSFIKNVVISLVH